MLGPYRRALTLGALSLAVLVAACTEKSATQPTTTAAGVLFSFPSADLLIGGVEQATAKVVDANGVVIPNASITWTSSVTSVATVTDSGIVQGLSPGLTLITATSGVATDTATITVDSAGTVRVDSIRPSQLVQGQPAVIFGANFSHFPTGNIVIVGFDSITPIAATTTQLNIVVPTAGCAPAQKQQFVVVARGSAAADSVPVAPNITPVKLGVGQVTVLSGATALSCIQFAASDTSVIYLVVVGNVTSSLDANASFLLGTQVGSNGLLGFGSYGHIVAKPRAIVRGRKTLAKGIGSRDSGLGTRGGRKAQRVPRGRTVSVGRAPQLRRPRFEAWLRAYERRRLSPFGVRAALAHIRSIVPTVGNVPAVGDTVQLNVPVSGCENFKTTTGVVQAVGTHGIIVQDVTAPPGGFQASDFQSISSEFDRFIYPTDTVHFGGPSDIDSNGRVILYYTPAINSLTETGVSNDASLGFVPGFFFAGDLFPRTASSTASACPESNLGEIFYLAVPDPAGQFGPVLTPDTIRQATRGTVAHELEHLINAANRIFKSGGALEDVWLDEALAHSAEDFVGRAEYGYTDVQPLTFALVHADTGTYMAFFQPNAIRFSDWLGEPSFFGAADSRADTSLSVRGAAWSLLRFAEDQFSAGVPATLTRQLALGPTTGIANLTQGTGVPFDTVVAGWLIANVTSGNDTVTVAPRFTYLSYNMRDVQAGLTGSTTYPLDQPTVTLPLTPVDIVDSATVQGNGGAYFQYSAPVATGTSGPSMSIEITNGDATVVSFPGARVYLLRLQ